MGRGAMKGLRQYHRRDCVLEDQLLLIIRLQYHRILIEALDSPGQFDPTHEINRQEDLIFSSVIEERFLDVLRKLFHFIFLNCFGQRLFGWQLRAALHIEGSH